MNNNGEVEELRLWLVQVVIEPSTNCGHLKRNNEISLDDIALNCALTPTWLSSKSWLVNIQEPNRRSAYTLLCLFLTSNRPFFLPVDVEYKQCPCQFWEDFWFSILSAFHVWTAMKERSIFSCTPALTCEMLFPRTKWLLWPKFHLNCSL